MTQDVTRCESKSIQFKQTKTIVAINADSWLPIITLLKPRIRPALLSCVRAAPGAVCHQYVIPICILDRSCDSVCTSIVHTFYSDGESGFRDVKDGHLVPCSIALYFLYSIDPKGHLIITKKFHFPI